MPGESKTKAKTRIEDSYPEPNAPPGVVVDSDSPACAVGTTTAGPASPLAAIPEHLIEETIDRVAVMGKTPKRVRQDVTDMLEHCGSAPMVRMALRNALERNGGDPLALAWATVRGQVSDARREERSAPRTGPPRKTFDEMVADGLGEPLATDVILGVANDRRH
jgi:hypothetical protein